MQPANDYIDPNVPLRLADAIKYGFPEGGRLLADFATKPWASRQYTPRRRALHHQPAKGRTRRTGMAGRDGTLLLVVEHNGPTMLARIRVMRALNRHVESAFKPARKKKRT